MAHTHIIGQTGNGSDDLLKTQILSDISHTYKTINKTTYTRGVFVFDPHGRTIDWILPRIPKARIKDTVLFDPNFPIAWNPLHNVSEALAASIVDTFRAINGYDISANLFQKSLYSAVAALIEAKCTLFDVKYMFISDKFRKSVVQSITNPVIRRFWKVEFPALTTREQNELVRSAETTFHILISDPRIAAIVAQHKSLIELSNPTQIFLAKIPQGDFGIQRSATIGSLLLGQLYNTIQQCPVDHLSVYVLDCHHLAPSTLIEMLTAGSQYGLRITLAHQTLSQLDWRLKDAILGCADFRHVFRVSQKDADELDRINGPDNINVRPNELAPGIYRTYPINRLQPDNPATLPLTVPNEKARERVLRANEKYHRPIDLNARVESF